jgi:hypothetical protein
MEQETSGFFPHDSYALGFREWGPLELTVEDAARAGLSSVGIDYLINRPIDALRVSAEIVIRQVGSRPAVDAWFAVKLDHGAGRFGAVQALDAIAEGHARVKQALRVIHAAHVQYAARDQRSKLSMRELAWVQLLD